MADINIFTSNDDPNELRCTLTSGVLSVSKVCLKKNARNCFLDLADSLPANSIDDGSDDYKAFVAELNKASCRSE